MKKNTLLLIFVLITFVIKAQIPAGYYNGTGSLSGTALQQALHNIIDNHTSVSYSSIWNHIQNTDKTSNNKVWDMYSDTPGSTPPYVYSFATDQCGSYSSEGDCYNREHSWPQSWFNSGSPMKTDLFQVYPTDGYVNGQRGSYPYGEVGSVNWTSQNGSKRGSCNYPGYTGEVFEPINAYKGDFARTYFYMSTRYYGEDSGWQNNGMVNGAELLPWAQNLLMEWHIDDPVSTKETDRNNAVYNIQGNRNPFIDHPEFAMLIFSSNYPQPVFSSTPVTTAFENSFYEYLVTASDSYGNQISFSSVNLPNWLILTDNGNNTATLSGTPLVGDIGLVSISVSANNHYSPATEQVFVIDVSPVTGIVALDNNPAEILIYPNPVIEIINIESTILNSSGISLSIIDILGQIISEEMIVTKNGMMHISTSNLTPGVYFLQIKCKDNQSQVLRFVKE